jgi:hypothetical protein
MSLINACLDHSLTLLSIRVMSMVVGTLIWGIHCDVYQKFPSLETCPEISERGDQNYRRQ